MQIFIFIFIFNENFFSILQTERKKRVEQINVYRNRIPFEIKIRALFTRCNFRNTFILNIEKN